MVFGWSPGTTSQDPNSVNLINNIQQGKFVGTQQQVGHLTHERWDGYNATYKVYIETLIRACVEFELEKRGEQTAIHRRTRWILKCICEHNLTKVEDIRHPTLLKTIKGLISF